MVWTKASVLIRTTHLTPTQPFYLHRLDWGHNFAFHRVRQSAGIQVSRSPNSWLDLPGSLEVAQPPTKKNKVLWFLFRHLPVEAGGRQGAHIGSHDYSMLDELHVIPSCLSRFVLDHHLVLAGPQLHQSSRLQDAVFWKEVILSWVGIMILHLDKIFSLGLV